MLVWTRRNNLGRMKDNRLIPKHVFVPCQEHLELNMWIGVAPYSKEKLVSFLSSLATSLTAETNTQCPQLKEESLL